MTLAITSKEHFQLLRDWLEKLKPANSWRILDLGTGCGVRSSEIPWSSSCCMFATSNIQACKFQVITFILRSMYSDMTVTASDLCPNAVFSVRAELQRWGVQGVKVVQSDLFAKLEEEGPFDLIIFNPPWVPRAPEVQPSAGDVVFGNDYPADLFDRLFAEAPAALRPGGHLAAGQAVRNKNSLSPLVLICCVPLRQFYSQTMQNRAGL